MDPALLVTALHAGATIVGTEVVKEITKDTYKSLKGAVGDLFGRRATAAIDQVENAPEDAKSLENLKTVITPDPSEMDELADKVTALLAALQADNEARKLAESVAKIRLRVDAGGNVLLDTMQGAREIDIEAKAGSDFVMKNIKMDQGAKKGN